jgi:hypothetical protein
MSFFFKNNNKIKNRNANINSLKNNRRDESYSINQENVKNVNSGTFMMGIGNGNFASNNLVFHLKNIETELDQKIIGKNSEHLYNSKNTFETIISKLKKQVQELNLKVQNYNKEKKEITEMSKKEVMRLKEIINNIYQIVKILTKSLDLNKEEKVKLLEKLRTTIEQSPGFLKSIDTISNNINKSLMVKKERKNSNVTMNQLLSNVNINKIATNIGESNKERHNSNPININVSQYTEKNSNSGKIVQENTLFSKERSSKENTLFSEERSSKENTLFSEKPVQDNSENKTISNYTPSININKTQLNHNQTQSNNHNKSITELNNYYQNLKDSHNSSKSKTRELTALQNRIKSQKITLNQAKEKLDKY